MAQPKHIAHPRHIASSRRVVFSPSTERGIKECLRQAPWATIALLTLVLILILALWGKLPSRLRLPHQAPSGNAPGVSTLHLWGLYFSGLYFDPSFRS